MTLRNILCTLFFLFFIDGAFAQTSLNLTREGGFPGETVTVKVTAKDFRDVGRMKLSFTWAINVLEFQAVCQTSLPALSIGNFFYTDIDNGRLWMEWDDPTGRGVSVPDDFVIMALCFEVVGSVGDMTPVNIVDNPITSEIFNIAGDPISFTRDQGSVTVLPMGFDPVELTASIEEVTPFNTSTCVEISVNNFEFLKNLDFSLSWNPSQLIFNSISNYNLENLSPNSFNTTNAFSDGRIAVNWSSLGASVPDETVIFEVCYTAIAIPGTTTPIRFEDMPTAISATHQNNRPINVNTNSGAVLMKFQPLNLNLTDVTGDPNEIVCLDLTTEFFANITDFAFELSWDPSVAKYDDAFLANLPDFDSDNLLFDNADPGSLIVTWRDSTRLGIFRDPNLILMSLCFEMIGAPGSSTKVALNSNSTAFSGFAPGVNVGTELFGGTLSVSDFFAQSTDVGNTTCLNKEQGFIDLNITGGVPPLNINWSNGAMTQDISNLPAGNYTVTITDSSTPPREVVRTFEVILDDAAAPTAQITGLPIADCINSPLTLDGTNSSQGNFSYSWGSTDGTVVSGAQTLEPTVQGSGTYILLVTDNDNGCCARAEIEVEDAIPPIAEINGSDYVLNCYSNTLEIDGGASSIGFRFDYNWTTTNGSIISSSDEIFVEVDQVGDYQLVVTDNETFCTAMTSVTVTENFNFPQAEAGPFKVITCDTLEQQLDGTGSSVGNNSYEWGTDGGYFVRGDDSLFPTVSASGLYVLSVRDDESGCITKDSIRVFGGSDLPFNNPGMDTVFNCRSTTIQLDGSRSAQGPLFEHYWYTTDGNIVDNWNTMTPTIDAPGIYAFEVYNRQTNCRSISSILVEDDTTPPAISTSQPFVEFPCDEDDIRLEIEGDQNAVVNYLWSTLNGSIIGGINQQVVFIDEPGTYLATAENFRNGCSSSVQIEVAPPVFPQAEISATSVIDCNNSLVQLSSSNSTFTPPMIFEWSTLDGEIEGDPNLPFADAMKAGTYSLVLRNPITGCSDSTSFLVQENFDEPIVALADTAYIDCQETMTELDASNSSDGADFPFTWNTLSGNILDSSSLIAEVDLPGYYYLIIKNETNGCEAIDSILVIGDTLSPMIVLNPTDSIGCSGELTIDASGSDAGMATWTAVQGGNIVAGSTTLMPTVNQPGIYEITLVSTDNGCTSKAQTEVVFAANLPPAEAGDDFSVCDLEGQVIGNLPANITGRWEAFTPGAGLEDVSAATTNISQLQQGRNLFVWFLSDADCSDYSSDTIAVTLEVAPDAQDDVFSAQPGSTEIFFDVFANDVISGSVSDLMFDLLSTPQIGVLESQGDGRYRFQFPSENASVINFEYEICNIQCPDLCDQATVELRYDGLDVLSEVPNVITPNGDGLNDELFFEELANGQFQNAELLVFNRWGDEVFRAQGYQNDWRGTNNSGKELPHATYYYVLKFDTAGRKVIKGHVTVMN